MRIVNKTDYPTRELRSIMCAVHANEPRGQLKQWKWVTVTIAYRRAGNRKFTGHAYYNGTRCHLSVPRDRIWVPDFAALWRHELWHLYGVHHRDYPTSLMWCKTRCVEHVDLSQHGQIMDEHPTHRYVLPVAKVVKLKPSGDTVKVARLLARHKTWASKQKRAETALKKINKSLRYYEKKAAARP